MSVGNEVSGYSLGSRPIVFQVIAPQGQHLTDLCIDKYINFHSLLDILDNLLKAHGDGRPNAFEYEDEEGDRITVRSDEELNVMINWHQWHCEQLRNGVDVYPITIYPKVGRSSARRNTLGLTVDIGTHSATPPRQIRSNSSSGRKRPEDLQAILSSGRIYERDVRYIDVIGHGNSGVVHKALHLPSQKTIAIKVTALDVTLEVQRQIISELDILYQCDSQYIIGFHGAFFLENKIYMCTEFMDGSSLDTYNQIPENVLGRIVVMVVKGLTYLWNLKIMHRDVKPSNILVDTSGLVKLCDFGVSIQLINSIAKTYVGTNAYMAPERILGDEYGIHSDVWSLGVSLIEMSTGEFPYPSDANKQKVLLPPIELLQCIVNEQPPTLSNEFGDALKDFVQICLKKNPKERPTPEQLSRHPYILQNDTENQKTIVAEFVTNFLNKNV